MNAHRKRHRAAEPAGDYGPRARFDNGTAVLTYRADPDKPHAPAIRAAKALIAYEALWSQGLLTDMEREAADRICVAAERVSGAKDGDNGGLRGRAFWESGGISPQAVAAAADLRAVGDVLDVATADAVIRLVCHGQGLFYQRAKAGLAAMAAHWRME
jgi:hypothetical protein